MTAFTQVDARPLLSSDRLDGWSGTLYYKLSDAPTSVSEAHSAPFVPDKAEVHIYESKATEVFFSGFRLLTATGRLSKRNRLWDGFHVSDFSSAPEWVQKLVLLAQKTGPQISAELAKPMAEFTGAVVAQFLLETDRIGGPHMPLVVKIGKSLVPIVDVGAGMRQFLIELDPDELRKAVETLDNDDSQAIADPAKGV